MWLQLQMDELMPEQHSHLGPGTKRWAIGRALEAPAQWFSGSTPEWRNTSRWQ